MHLYLFSSESIKARIEFGVYAVLAAIFIFGARRIASLFVRESEKNSEMQVTKQDILAVVLVYFGLTIVVPLFSSLFMLKRSAV